MVRSFAAVSVIVSQIQLTGSDVHQMIAMSS